MRGANATKQSRAASDALDCFAALAMTGRHLTMRDISIQVPPSRIKRLDQRQFPLPRPGLDLLLSHNRRSHRVMHFKPDQHLASISFGEAIRDALAMLPDTLRKIGRNPGVERTISLAGYNIGGRLFHRWSQHTVIARSGATWQSRAPGHHRQRLPLWIAALRSQ